ncbi:Fucoxanthin-chlorophyll a-c binding protein F [Durusdinium trenchii]|uniref:Chloroplastic n=1 Tax=Durusdinium trenchii TaxID=1381693 RepID=A0ABP0SF81_9DINO
MAETFVALGPDLRGQVSSATLPVTAPARAPAVLARGDPSSSNSSARCALSLLGLAALLSRGKTARAAKAKKQKKQVLKITEESFEEPDEATVRKMAKKNKKKKQRFDPADEIGVCAPLGFFDPLGFAPKNKRKNFKNLRAMEIKHGRIAMLATVGSVFQHFIHRPDLPAPWQTYIGTVNPVGIGALAIYYGPVGFIQLLGGLFLIFLFEFFFWLERDDRDPGDFGNPLGIPLDTPEMRLKELNNGRMAMISIVGIWAAELVTKKDAVEQLMFWA